MGFIASAALNSPSQSMVELLEIHAKRETIVFKELKPNVQGALTNHEQALQNARIALLDITVQSVLKSLSTVQLSTIAR